jgi:hypothetical protein
MSDAELIERLRLPWPKDGSGDEVTLPLWVLILTAEAADRIEALIEARDTMGHLWAKEAAAKQVAIGRIESLTEQLEAARADAKEAEAYAEELARDLVKADNDINDRDAKLAKAVEVLTRLLATAHADDHDGWQDALKDARTALAEIEGEGEKT